VGLDLMTLRSQPVPKPRVRHLTDWATQNAKIFLSALGSIPKSWFSNLSLPFFYKELGKRVLM